MHETIKLFVLVWRVMSSQTSILFSLFLYRLSRFLEWATNLKS